MYMLYRRSEWDIIDRPCKRACWVHRDARTKKPFITVPLSEPVVAMMTRYSGKVCLWVKDIK